MAELVRSHMESMTEEIEEMRRIKLFTKEETRILLKKRGEFEYKINGVTKNLQDFKDYIQYEKILLKDIRARRNKFRVMERKSAIEFKILRRIRYLYDIAIQRFSNDYQLFMAYFKFCKESANVQTASHIIQNMIKAFSDKEDVWKEAADWFMKRDLNQALTVVYRGLAIHSKSKILTTKAIDLELKNVEKNSGGQELCAKRLETIIQSILSNSNEFRTLLDILQTLTHYDFTVDIQKTILNWLLKNHKDEELVWHTLAEREFNGHHLVKSLAPTTPMYCLDQCIETYEEGLIKICIGNRSALWGMYLDFLIDIYFRPEKTVTVSKEKVASAIERASKDTILSDRYFVIWAQLLNDENEVTKVVEAGLKAVPDSVELWKLRLKYAVLKDDLATFNNLVKLGTAILKENSLPLWTMALRYHTLHSQDSLIEKIYEQAVEKPKEVSDVLKPDYIEWMALNKGIRHARVKYDELSKKVPHCKELHVSMANIESLEVDPDIDRWEHVLQLATTQFSDQLDLWKMLIELYLLQHREFEKKRPDFDLSRQLGEVYKKAEKAVENNDLLLAKWRTEFNDLTNSIDS